MSTTSTATPREHFASSREWSAIRKVAAAITSDVERHRTTSRWSFVYRGGPSALLRISARFLRTDHRTIFIGSRTLSDASSIPWEHPQGIEEPDRWCVLDVDRPLDAAEAGVLIEIELSEGSDH